MISKSISSVALAALALCAGAAQAVELTSNGGFETGTLAGWTTFSVPGKNTFGVTSTNPASGTFAGFASAIGSAAGATMKQANVGTGLPVTAGQLVTFSVDLRASIPGETGGVVYGPKLFSELAGGGVSGTLAINNGNPLWELSDGQWHHYTMTGNLGFDVSGGVSLEINVANGATGSLLTSTVWVDNASITAVPEPETYALMLAGLVGVGAMVRRRRAA